MNKQAYEHLVGIVLHKNAGILDPIVDWFDKEYDDSKLNSIYRYYDNAQRAVRSAERDVARAARRVESAKQRYEKYKKNFILDRNPRIERNFQDDIRYAQTALDSEARNMEDARYRAKKRADEIQKPLHDIAMATINRRKRRLGKKIDSPTIQHPKAPTIQQPKTTPVRDSDIKIRRIAGNVLKAWDVSNKAIHPTGSI